MGPVDVAVIVIVSIAVIGVAAYLVYRKIKHKGGCDCSSCGGNCHCCNRKQNND